MTGREQLRADLELLLQRLLGMSRSQGLSSLAEVDLSWSQVRVTMLLACSERLPIGAVADRLDVSIHSAGRTIDQLVDLGIVDRHECPTDRRVRLVSLTRRGLELIDGHVAEHRRALQRFVDRLPGDRADALGEALRPILAGDYLQPLSPGETAEHPAEADATDSPTTPALAGH